MCSNWATGCILPVIGKSTIETLKQLVAINEHVLESQPGSDTPDDKPSSKRSILFLVEI